MKALIFIQTEDNKILRSCVESMAGIQNVLNHADDSINTLFLDSSIQDELKTYEVNANYLITDIQKFNPLEYICIMESMINELKPDIIIFSHTYQTRDWVPRLSARLDIPFVSDCINIAKEEDGALLTKQMYQGKVNADIFAKGPVIVSFQSGAFRADEIKKGSSDIHEKSLNLNVDTNTIRPLDKFKESKGEVDLSSAEIIVSVGRGISKEEHMHLVKELSESLSAELGSSRPVVDYGWLPHERQVGSSGQVVSPKLYLAIGISGAIQHQVGMKGSDNIMAINKDPNAPIFEIADYGIVGDLFEIVPKLTELIKNHQS